MPVDHSGFWSPPTTVHPSELHAPFPRGYNYRDLIPAPTTQSPRELLEDFYRRHDHPDWTDPNGVLKLQIEFYQQHRENAAIPIGSSGLVATQPRPDGLAAVPVPVCGAGVTSDRRQVIVEFRNRDRGRPSKGMKERVCEVGFSLSDIFKMNIDLLEGANDIVLDGLEGKDLTFMIMWPGYEPERFAIRTVSGNGGPMTRFHLGQQLVSAYSYFFGKVEEKKVLPKEVGFYNIALHQGLKARSDSLGVQLTQLHLIRIRSTISRNWVADIEIV
ncbi:hypothetical protein J3R83DRAFT_8049 [Lanmaoa asiatica]|nr:hypothetical protein J3R83DRAFT_8049 [Lanmaoa asiatica]